MECQYPENTGMKNSRLSSPYGIRSINRNKTDRTAIRLKIYKDDCLYLTTSEVAISKI
jgi:hypothetical protein